MRHSAAITCALASLALATPASATWTQVSGYGTRVAQDDGDNGYFFCETSIETEPLFGTDIAVAKLYHTDSAGNVSGPVADPSLQVTVRAQCFSNADLSGVPLVSTSLPSGADDVVTVGCVPFLLPRAAYVECSLAQIGGDPWVDPYQKPFIYHGTACGDGVDEVLGSNLVAQLTGQEGWGLNQQVMAFYDYNAPEPTAPLFPWWTKHVDAAGVMGTDLGIPMFSNGKLHFIFGDTNMTTPTGNHVYHSTMATADILNPVFDRFTIDLPGAWYGTSATDHVTDQLVALDLPDEQVCENWTHDGESFTGAVPQGAFSLTEGGHNYKYLTLTSMQSWEYTGPSQPCSGDSVKANRGTVAYSVDDGPYQRLDEDYGSVSDGTWWDADDASAPGESHFVSMRAMHPIFGSDAGYVYFYGFAGDGNMGHSDSSLRVARVRAQHAAIVDKGEYEYWGHPGGDASQPPQWLPAEPQHALDVIPASENVRDVTVAYDSYVNRYLMMVMNSPKEKDLWFETKVRLLQSETPQGPWTYVADVPNTSFLNYAPQMHERMMLGKGQRIAYLLSDWNAYNVGSWYMNVSRNVKHGCQELY